MAYLVLARKYRPQSFADMTGQEHVVKTLSNALVTERVAHALLFCGPRGCGKTTTARIVAKALNCEKGPTPNPCGVCTPCREIAAGTDVDVQEIDAASNTGVDNVRELRESAKYMPARDRYKIFIVDEVHMLSKAAFNAFLKTLEEPPAHVKFLFATTDPQALPDTILSRCQRHNFRLVPLKQIVERIQHIAAAENVKIDEGAVALVARQAAGSMRDALSILDQLFSSCGGTDVPITAADAAQALGALDQSVVADLAEALLRREAGGVLGGVARAYDGGHDLRRLAEDLASHFRNLIAVSVAGASLDLPDHELKALQTQAAGAEPATLARLFELVHGALSEMSRAAQPRHALEIALLRAVYLAPADSIQSLLRRADELARRMGSPSTPPPGGGGGGGARPAPATPPASPPPAPTSRWTPPGSNPASRGPSASSSNAALAQAGPSPGAAPRASWERHLTLVPSEEPPVAKPQEPAVAAAPQPPAPPASPPAASVVTRAPNELDARWPGVVASVKQARPRLAAYLEHARPLSFESGVLSLGFERGSSFIQQIQADAQTLEGLLETAFGSAVRLSLVEGAGGVETLVETAEREASEARQARLLVGREHPSVLRAMALLGAEIEEVKDLGGLS